MVKKKLFTKVCIIVFILCYSNLILFIPTASQAAIPIQSLKINNTLVKLSPDQTFQLTVTILPGNASNQRLEWTAENANVVSVSNTGILTAKNPGTTRITCATNDGSYLKSFCTIEVAQLANSISLNRNNAEISTGNNLNLNCSFSPASTTNKTLSWKSKDNSIASVNNGVVTGNRKGVTEIYCTTTDGSNKRASCSITVRQSATDLSINKSNITLNVGEYSQLIAAILPSDTFNKKIQWTSNSNIVSIDDNGKIYARSTGRATITCKTMDGSGLTSNVSITVTEKSIENTNSNDNSVKNPAASSEKENVSPSEKYKEPGKEQDIVSSEMSKLSDEQIEGIFENVFATVSDGEQSDDENKKEEKAKVDKLLNPKITVNKNDTINLQWDKLNDFTGYEVWSAIDAEYYLVADGDMEIYIKNNYFFKTKYAYKIRAYIVNLEGKKVYSDFTVPISTTTKSKGFWSVIEDFFVSVFT